MISDVLCSLPWQCGDNDCQSPGGWHKGTYWTHRQRFIPRELPEAIKTYLNLNPRGRLQDFQTWQELAEAVPQVQQQRWCRLPIAVCVKRPQAAYQRALRAAARKHLAHGKRPRRR